MKRKRMTTIELNLIRELREKRISLSEVALRVNRTKESISFICHYYKLPNNEWTAEENKLLISEYGHHSSFELSKKLNRSAGSIRTQMYKQKRNQ